ncbi:hypothetical protein O9H85_31760 [Paenibacillus filicis]|uniref:Beta-ketoacyl synthase N-terminal domain-containing protein n=1 Tax=Paenibacillus gyeongsangnamensis TaxID=3388067 RepID=A0ABT4QJ08_9BACL|nr:hypothetical protein [Paenibacillus filicis]MCZ8516859.1 hypothetical protein [Paenibacillus filicis]
MKNRFAITGMSIMGKWGSGIDQFIDFCDGKVNDEVEIPIVPGFVKSNFSPLVYHNIKKLMETCTLNKGSRTAILLGSIFGDSITDDLSVCNSVQRQPLDPLLFAQSIPNAVLGFISRQFNMTGTFSCITSMDPLLTVMLEMSELLLCSDDADQVVLTAAEIANPRNDEIYSQYFKTGCKTKHRDIVASIVVETEENALKNHRPILFYIDEYKELSQHHDLVNEDVTLDFSHDPLLFSSTYSFVKLLLTWDQMKKSNIQSASIIDRNLNHKAGKIEISLPMEGNNEH